VNRSDDGRSVDNSRPTGGIVDWLNRVVSPPRTRTIKGRTDRPLYIKMRSWSTVICPFLLHYLSTILERFVYIPTVMYRNRALSPPHRGPKMYAVSSYTIGIIAHPIHPFNYQLWSASSRKLQRLITVNSWRVIRESRKNRPIFRLDN